MAILDEVLQTLEIQPTGIPTVVRLSQNENGRQIRLTLRGQETNFPAGCLVTISGTKPDGVVYSASGSLDGNVAVINEDTQMTAVSGMWKARVNVTYGGSTIVTELIVFEVYADPVDPGSVPSESELNGLVAEAQYWAENARSSAYGSPLVSETAAEMIETDRVYVYTGSETGYTAGHWYYYDAGWQDGGIYQSGGITTDATLSIPGAAADAKATGDELSQRFALTTGDRTSIPTGSDLDDYTTTGNYKVTTGTIAGNISNIPQAVAGTLVVMTGSDAQKWYQIYFAQPSVASLRIYVRQKRSDSLAWTDWIELTYRYTFDSAPTASSTNPVTSGGVYTAIRESADDLMEKIAPAYSNTSTYKLGDLCAYNGTIYKCSIEIATAEEWTEAHWEVTNVTDNLQDISEYVNATYVSDIPQTDYFGLTRISENHKLKLYGTMTANRHLLFLNGQDAGMITTSAFQKTLDAGTYLFDFHMTGYKTTGTLRGTYTTFANPFDIALGSKRTAIYTFTQPVMIGLNIYNGNDFGTESDPTYVTVDAYKLTAKDEVARERVPAPPAADGVYTLKCTVTDGVPAYSWEVTV